MRGTSEPGNTSYLRRRAVRCGAEGMNMSSAPGGSVCGRRNATPASLRSAGRHSRRLIATGAALLALGVLSVFAAPAGLADAGETVDIGRLDEIDCDPSPTELEDIEFIAEQDGIPLDEAIARHGWQGCFGAVTSYLDERYSDEYAGAAIVDDGRGAWIAFKGDVPEEAAALVEAIPVTVELIGGKGFSEAELNELLPAVYYDVSSHEDVVAASGSYDIETGVITINAQPVESLTDPAQRERLREMLRPNQPANTAITVEVVIVDELGGVDEASSSQTGGQSPATYASLLAAAGIALLAGLLMRRKRLG